MPKVMLLPVFFFPEENGELAATTDSTPIIRQLEAMSPERSIMPDDPVLTFLNYIIEDYADESLTKAMMHYRWAHRQDIDHARQYLVYLSMPTIDAESAESFSTAFAERQTSRLYVVGSNETTCETVEASYRRLLSILDNLIAANRFVFGTRATSLQSVSLNCSSCLFYSAFFPRTGSHFSECALDLPRLISPFTDN